MEPTFASRIERLRGHMEVPAAAVLFSGFALALFVWPGSGPSKAPAQASPPSVPAEPRLHIRQIAITEGDAAPAAPRAPAAPPLVLAELPASPPVQAADPKRERPSAKRAGSAHRPAVVRRSPEARPAAGPASARVEVQSAPAPSNAGILDRTLTLGSAAVEIAAGGADYAKSAAFRLGRSVASLIDERI